MWTSTPATSSMRDDGTQSAASVKAPPSGSISNMGPKRVRVPLSSHCRTRARSTEAGAPSSRARASHGCGTRGSPRCSTFSKRRSNSSMRGFQGVAPAALLELPDAEQQAVRQVIQAGVLQYLVDLLADVAAALSMNHAEQVVWPVGQAARPLVAQVDAGCPAQLLPRALDQFVRYIQHQHGIGAITQRAMMQYHAYPTEQACSVPVTHLGKHGVFCGVYLAGKVPVWLRHQGQAFFEQAAQLPCLGGRQGRGGCHVCACSENPRSTRNARTMGRSSGSSPVDAAMSARMRSMCARSGAVMTNHRFRRCD